MRLQRPHPVIGHLKSDHRLDRNFLKGFNGDQINLLMAAAAFNFKKWMRAVNFWLQNISRIFLLITVLVFPRILIHRSSVLFPLSPGVCGKPV
mgnify:CR=1 FL=1